MKRIKKLLGGLIASLVLAVCGLVVPTYTAKAENTVDVTEKVTASGWVAHQECPLPLPPFPSTLSFARFDNTIPARTKI